MPFSWVVKGALLTVAHMCLMQRKIGGKNCFQFQHSDTCWYKIQLRKLDSRDWYWKLLFMSLDSYGTSWHISWTWTMTSSLDLWPSFQAKGSQFPIVARVCIETILQDFGFDPLNNGHQDQREVTAGPWFITDYNLHHIIYCCCYMLTWTSIMSWLHRR